MARNALCRIFSVLNAQPRIVSNAVAVRSYSLYPPNAREPVYEPEKLDEIFQTVEAKKLEGVPIRAARNDQNASVFHDETVNAFINLVMEKGQKQLARKIVETGFTKIKHMQLTKYYKATTDEERNEIELNPVTIFHKAVANCTPVLKLTPIKRGGSTYQVPVAVRPAFARFMAMRWIIEEVNEKEKKVHFPEKFAYEILEAANNTGKVVKRKQDLHRQCEANRAYAHYRWG